MRWLEAYSSHRVGVGSVSAVCPAQVVYRVVAPMRLLLLLLLFSCLANVSRSGSIVVVGDPIFENVSGFGVVVLVEGLRGHHFTEARAPKWAKVIKLPRREH